MYYNCQIIEPVSILEQFDLYIKDHLTTFVWPLRHHKIIAFGPALPTIHQVCCHFTGDLIAMITANLLFVQEVEKQITSIH